MIKDTFDIVACGATGNNWPGNRVSIGVNDSWKFGKPTTHLLVANHASKFEPDRLSTIKNSTPIKFFSNSESWRKYFPDMVHFRTESWNGQLIKNRGLTTLTTSPVIAMHLAWQLGADRIVLWGVDFNDHPECNGVKLKQEIRQYKAFIEALKINGVEVYLGCEGSVLQEFLQIHEID